MHYVLGDIHGHLPRFEAILREIDLKETDTLFLLGDLIDRNPEGLTILSRVMEMPNARMILGNHELMMIRTLTTQHPVLREKYRDLWYSNGGEVTHDAWKQLPEARQQEMLAYLMNLPLNLEVSLGGYVYLLVHGAPAAWYNSTTSHYSSQAEYAVWHRITLQEVAPAGKILIFGHTPTQMYQYEEPAKIWRNEDVIGLDCGCAYETGRLACMRLEDQKVFYAS